MITLLYVDDEEALLELGKVFLEQSDDFTVNTCGSAREGLKALSAGACDAIISDYQMPEMDGIGFLKEVRGKYGSIPFILFTGKGREEVVIEAINSGADFYVQKGGEPTAQFAELSHKIRQAVTRQRAQDELRAAYEQIAATEEELRSQYDALVISERRTRESEKIFRELFDLVPASCIVTDPDGKFILMNRAFEENTGLSQEDVIGKTGHELGLSDPVADQALRDALARDGRIDGMESVARREDGSERAILVSARPVTINAVPHVITVIVDITEQKHTEEILRESEERFRAMIDQSPFAIIVFTPDGNAIHANGAHLRLWSITLDMVKQYNILRDPQVERLGILPVVKRAFAGEHSMAPPVEYDLHETLGTGERRTVRGDFYPIRSRDDRVTHVILVHQIFPAGS